MNTSTAYFDSNLIVGRRASPRPENDLTTEQIIDDMAWAGIGHALATHAAAVEYDPLIGNQRLTELTQIFPQLAPCYTVQPHPSDGFPQGSDLVDYLASGGARAVRIFPLKHSFSLSRTVSGNLLTTLEEAGIPVFLDMMQTNFEEVDDLLSRHPDLKLILLRVGYRINQWLYPLLEKHPNLHFELALYPLHRGIEEVARRFGASRMLFGTGLPVWDAGAAVSHIEYAKISTDEKQAIAAENLKSLLWPETAPEVEAKPVPEKPRDPIWALARAGQPLSDEVVIDPHTHMGPYHNFPIPGDPWAEGMIEVMDECGVDSAVTAPMIALEGGVREGNEIAADAILKFPGRFFGFCTINPNFPEEEIREELQHCFQNEGFRGIKIHPTTHDYAAYRPGYIPVWEFAHERELPILIHTWGTDPKCRPALFDPIAEQYPRARLILGHSGAMPLGIDEAIEVARKRPNVYLDLTKSIICRGMLEYMVNEVGPDRILYGSDLPFICGTGQLGRAAAARLSLEEKRKILGLNAQQLFRL
jgi:hypothetical protein